MENSLASMFMEASPPCLPLSWGSSSSSSGESIEELQQQLAQTSMELENAQQAATLQTNLNRALLGRLQGLLDSARKERDDARDKCERLQNCIYQLSSSSGGSSSRSAPQRKACSDDTNNSSFHSLVISPSMMPPHQLPEASAAHNHREPLIMSACPKEGGCGANGNGNGNGNCNEEEEEIPILEEFATDELLLGAGPHDMFATLDPSAAAMEDQNSRANNPNSRPHFGMGVLHGEMGVLNGDMGALNDEEDQGFHDIIMRSGLPQGDQAPMWDTSHCQEEARARAHQCPTQCSSQRRPSHPNSCAWVDAKNVLSPSPPPKLSCIPIQSGGVGTSPCKQALGTNPCKQALGTNPYKQALGTNPPCTQSLGTNPQCKQPLGTNPSQQALASMTMSSLHPGEPRSSNGSMVVGPLPEKGKLLQAIMDAGPLLQTLIVAGMLPEWSRPPPLRVLDIVKAPLSPSSVLWSPVAGDCAQLPQLRSQPLLLPLSSNSVMQDVLPNTGANLGLRRCKSANLRGKFDCPSITFTGSVNAMHNGSSSTSSSSSGPRRKLYKLLPQTS